MQTELKKDEAEGARDREAIGGAVIFLSSIADSALIIKVHSPGVYAQDGGGTKPEVGTDGKQATGTGSKSRSLAQTDGNLSRQYDIL
jgi:hypothetical protein